MLKRISYSIILNILSQGILFVVFLISAKLLGPAGRGVISAAVAMVTLMGTLAGFSIGRITSHRIMESGKTAIEYYKDNFFNVFLLLLISITLGFVSFAIIQFAFPNTLGKINPISFWITFLSLPYFVWSSYSMYIFSNMDKIRVQNNIALICKLILLVVSTAYFFSKGLTENIFLFSFSMVNLINFLCDQVYLFKVLKYKLTISWLEVKGLFINGLKVHFDTIGYILYSSLLIVTLNANVDIDEVGLYNFSAQLISIIIIIPTVTSQYINTSCINSTPKLFWPQHKKILGLSLTIILIICLLAYYLLPILISYLGLRFEKSIPFFNLLLLTVLPNSFATLMSPQWLTRGYFKSISAITLLAGISGYVSMLIFVEDLKGYAAVLLNLVIYAIVAVANLFFYFKINAEGTKGCH